MNDKKETLPADWHWVQLGDVCRQDKRIIEPQTESAQLLRYIGLEHIESESGRILLSDTSIDELSFTASSVTFVFDNRHVLYSKLRPYLNKVALPDFRGCCTTELIPLLPSKVITREYLALLLRREETVTAAMLEKKGARMPRADVDKVLTLSIPLPPLDYQKCVVENLKEQIEALNEARHAAEQQLATLKLLPASLSRQALKIPRLTQDTLSTISR